MSKNEKNVREISKEEMANVAGGYIVEVNPKDAENEKLGKKKYLVIDEQSDKILNSFNEIEDAIASDAVANYDRDWVLKVPKGKLHKHILKSPDDGSLVFKEWIKE
ncbi:MAG: hypothetical protein Q4D57_05410 [Clostridia bacterium]|nr:hypothetical protein [Clostridia bacterium]